MEKLNKQAASAIVDYIRTHFKMIDVQPGFCRYNFYCHSNAVHDAITDNDDELAMVVYIDQTTPIVHFISVKQIDGAETFIDNTLGQWSTRHDYYLIKKIHKNEYWDVHVMHEKFKQVLRSQLKWYVRLLSDFGG